MNKEYNRDLKSLNIRDVQNKAHHRQVMGYFKSTANRMDIPQSELLSLLDKKSIEEVNADFDAGRLTGLSKKRTFKVVKYVK